jgi:hypothetical protein
MSENGNITNEDFRDRVLYALLRPAAKVAKRFGVPLKELIGWLRIAYFHEFRNNNETLEEAADGLGVSIATAARLSRGLKQNFFRPDREHVLQQRIEFMLWPAPLSAARIRQCLPEVPADDVDEALQRMSEEGRLRQTPGKGTFEVATGEGRLVRDHWVPRLGALDSLLGNVSEAVRRRFFLERDDRSFARTLNFRVSVDRLDELQSLYETSIYQALADLERQSRTEDTIELKLSVVWAPSDEKEIPR